MVLQACIDGSQRDGQVLVLGGYLAPADNWAAFSEQWEHALLGPPNWPLLKSKGAKRRLLSDESFKKRYIEHYDIILRHAQAAICVAVPIAPFMQVCHECNVPRFQRNPYFIAFNSLISLYVGHARKINMQEPLELIFDDQSDKVHILNAWDRYTNNMPKRFRPFILGAPAFKADSRFLPLQAADLIAYWKRCEYEERGTIVDRLGPMVPWESREASHAHLYGELNETGIRCIVLSQFGTRYGLKTSFFLPDYGAGFFDSQTGSA
jgi:hypothetical protein